MIKSFLFSWLICLCISDPRPQDILSSAYHSNRKLLKSALDTIGVPEEDFMCEDSYFSSIHHELIDSAAKLFSKKTCFTSKFSTIDSLHDNLLLARIVSIADRLHDYTLDYSPNTHDSTNKEQFGVDKLKTSKKTAACQFLGLLTVVFASSLQPSDEQPVTKQEDVEREFRILKEKLANLPIDRDHAGQTMKQMIQLAVDGIHQAFCEELFKQFYNEKATSADIAKEAEEEGRPIDARLLLSKPIQSKLFSLSSGALAGLIETSIAAHGDVFISHDKIVSSKNNNRLHRPHGKHGAYHLHDGHSFNSHHRGTPKFHRHHLLTNTNDKYIYINYLSMLIFVPFLLYIFSWHFDLKGSGGGGSHGFSKHV